MSTSCPPTPLNPAPTPRFQGSKATAKVQHDQCPLMIKGISQDGGSQRWGGGKGTAGRMDHPLISGISEDLKELVLNQRGDEGGRQGQAGLHFAHRSYANSM